MRETVKNLTTAYLRLHAMEEAGEIVRVSWEDRDTFDFLDNLDEYMEYLASVGAIDEGVLVHGEL